jgi:Mg2+ and Co2+ transporter CorA
MSNQMDNIMDYIYGPLPKDYCVYFYFLSIFGFILMIFTFVTGLFIAISKKKDVTFYIQIIMASLAYGLFYFQNRLLNSMCVSSLQNK